MRNSTSLALLSASTLILALGISTTAQAQSVPVQEALTPKQADQARERDRNRAEHVRIGQDWKARGDDSDRAGRVEDDSDQQTVGQNWRVHHHRQGR